MTKSASFRERRRWQEKERGEMTNDDGIIDLEPDRWFFPIV
jgi:hypothetical protein